MPDSKNEILALNESARHQSISGPPVQEFVTVAVLPERFEPAVVPANGIGAAGAFDFFETVNHTHMRKIPEPGAKESWRVRAGITTQRNRKNRDVPPFRMRKVTYEVWRKHYAKDKDGNYRGTHAPAEDCLLKPEDVVKWSAEAPENMGDTWTRGRRALPGYGEVQDAGAEPLPEYVDQTSDEENAEAQRADFKERVLSNAGSASATRAVDRNDPEYLRKTNQAPPSGRTLDGKTPEQIIEEAKAKIAAEKRPKSWKNAFRGWDI